LFRKIIISLLIGFIAGTLGYFFLHSSFFAIRKIEVCGDPTITTKKLAECKLKEGGNIFLLKLISVRKGIENISRVEKVGIKKELPDKVTVKITLRKPVAFLEGRNLGVDQQGVAFRPRGSQRENYKESPKITGANKDILLGKSSPILKKGIEAYTAVEQLPLQIKTINVSNPQNIILYTRERNTEIRMGDGDFTKKAIYLEALLEKLQSRRVEYIDLRFGRDIIVR